MRNPHFEHLKRAQREHHRRYPHWATHPGGLFLPHAYPDPNAADSPPSPRSWDDAGFVLNGRRVMVFWQHPHAALEEALECETLNRMAATENPLEGSLLAHSVPLYRLQGASRKAIRAYRMAYFAHPDRAAWAAQYEAVFEAVKKERGDNPVPPSFHVINRTWARQVFWVAPLTIRYEADAVALAGWVKAVLKGEARVESFLGLTPTKEGSPHE
jgi:hypothetical protein